MRNAKVFFLQFYNLNKIDFWIINLVNIGLGLTLFFYPMNSLVEGAIVFLMFLKTLSFIRSAQVMPSISSDFDRFSWKYFQGLPLNKSEITVALVSTNVLVFTCMLVWGLSFFHQLDQAFDYTKGESLELWFMLLVFFFPSMMIISFQGIINQIIYPRRQYSKNDPKIVFYSTVKVCLYIFAFMLYSLLGYLFLEKYIDLSPGPAFYKLIVITFDHIFSWWALLPLTAYTLFSYGRVLNTWQDERIGYFKINWVPKRDLALMGLTLALIMIPLYSVEFDFSTDYHHHSRLHKAVQKNDVLEVKRLLTEGEKINQRNLYGFVPIHIAALNGNVPMYKFLESQKADARIEVRSKKYFFYNDFDVLKIAISKNHLSLVKHIVSQGHDLNRASGLAKNTALHYASGKCRDEIVDVLLEKGADINAKNADGESALHVAAAKGCFASATFLVDAGIDLTLKNNKGKLAFDLAKESGPSRADMSLYLARKIRAPASR
jgi:Ankyrin repeats (3 copies)/Ankyrin repeats (many copies)